MTRGLSLSTFYQAMMQPWSFTLGTVTGCPARASAMAWDR